MALDCRLRAIQRLSTIIEIRCFLNHWVERGGTADRNLELLGEVVRRFGWIVTGCTMLDNHFSISSATSCSIVRAREGRWWRAPSNTRGRAKELEDRGSREMMLISGDGRGSRALPQTVAAPTRGSSRSAPRRQQGPANASNAGEQDRSPRESSRAANRRPE